MKRVAISQRVDPVPGRTERRDALDQRWHGFLRSCGALALPVPNDPEAAAGLLALLRPDAIILSGGNDLVAVGGNAPERDATEARLLDYGIANGIPVIGICRGMQFLIHHFGLALERLEGHVAMRHPIDLPGRTGTVNSFHNWGSRRAPDQFRALALAPDRTVEAMQHLSLPVYALMWHPERESPYDAADIDLIRTWIGSRPGKDAA